MTWQSNPAFITLRNLVRKTGFTKAIGRLRPKRGYERAFNDTLFVNLHEGDIVWDVGANVGYYTKRFAEAVGAEGRVYAFEPFPDTAARLCEALVGVENYSLEVVALGAEEGAVTMVVGGDKLGATNRIVEGARDGGTEIEIQTADAVLATGRAEAPTVIKIDTEGFELDVLQGMQGMMAGTSALRALFIEVHFGLLADRGMPNAPAEIERLLKAHGFDTRWVDASHIAAVRN